MDVVDKVRVKTGVRGAWYVLFFSATMGALLLRFAGHGGDRPFAAYNPDILGTSLVIAAAICFPVMVSAHLSSLAGYRELSRRQCQVVKAGLVGAFAIVWVACRAMDLAALGGFRGF